MSLIINCLIALIAGAVYDGCCVGWVHFSEKHMPYHTALFAMLLAAAQVAGVGESVHDIRVAPFFILGYGIGAFIAVSIKKRYNVIKKEK